MRLTLTFLSCLLYSILFSQTEYPDNSFGDHGTVITPFNEGAEIYAITMQKDLKIIAAGESSHYVAIARYNPDGTLDSSFGFDGTVETLIPGTVPAAHAVAVQKDGKIVVAGTGNSNSSIAFVARYLSNGTPDPSFGTYGLVFPTIANVSDGISGMVLQNDQKILVCGQSNVSLFAPSSFSMFRLNQDGTRDSSFGLNGAVFTDFLPNGYSGAADIKLQFGNKILLVGDAGYSGEDIALARFNLNGSLDSSFGKNGKVMQDFGASEVGTTVGLDSNNKIIVGGYQTSGDYTTENFLVCRFKSNGKLDLSFGSGGKQITDLYGGSDINNALALDKNDNIIACGYSQKGGVQRFAAVKYDPNGKIDSSFWPAPILIIDTGLLSFGNAVYIQPDNKILLGGMIRNSDNDEGNFLLLRYAKSQILSSDILHFTVQKMNGNVQVKWQSENDINTEMFNVQRSFDGIHFSTIGTLQVKSDYSASQNYLFIDETIKSISPKKAYYRLQKIDKNGSSDFSNVQVINFFSSTSAFTITPNPAKDNIRITSSTSISGAHISIADINGRKLYNVNQDLVANQQSIIPIKSFSSGILIVSISFENEVKSYKIIKQ